MADIKKFLDQEGLKQLWAKINMQDYPNNDMLMAVINAIDETKADRNEIPSLSGLATEDYVNARIPAWSLSEECAILQVVNGIPTWVLFVDAEEVSF